MTRKIQEQFREKYGEPGYTAYEVIRMLERLGFPDVEVKSIRYYSRILGLFTDISEDGIKSERPKTKNIIRKSNLEALISTMDIDVSLLDLEKAATQLGYLTK